MRPSHIVSVCAYEDATLPAPHVTDEQETWGVIAEHDIEEEDMRLYDGFCNENAPQFRRGNTVEIMLALDPDVVPEEVESSEDEQGAPKELGGAPESYLDSFDPLEPDVAEAEHVSAQPIPTEADILMAIRGRAPPAWRR